MGYCLLQVVGSPEPQIGNSNSSHASFFVNTLSGNWGWSIFCIMDSLSAKFSLQNEVKDQVTDVHKPLSNKYATWKIIDYLWTCHVEKQQIYEYKDWLLNLYKENGMTEEEAINFSSEVDLIVTVIERSPLSK